MLIKKIVSNVAELGQKINIVWNTIRRRW